VTAAEADGALNLWIHADGALVATAEVRSL